MNDLSAVKLSTLPVAGEKNKNNENIEDFDERLLREMGYKQELYRGFSPLMSFAFCFTTVNVITSISLGFTYTLNTGGVGVAIWSWLIGSIFTILIGLSLAEICSVYPTAGSVYHWAGELVPVHQAPLTSFICGWFNFIGNAAGDAAFAAGFATILNAVIVLDGRPSLNMNSQIAIGIGIAFIWTIQNILRIDQQGWLNNFAAFFQIGSSIVTVIILFVMAPEKATVHDVFLSSYNGTGFPFAYVYCISILSTLFSFSGYDAGAHLAEETKGAGRAAPKGIIGTCICSAIFGFIYLLALVFVIPNVKSFIEHNSGDNESINLTIAAYQLALPNSIALVLGILLIVNIYFAGMSSLTVTSRIGYAMARDGVFPLSKYLTWIYKRTKTPLANVVFVFVIDCLLLSLQFISTTAFTAILATATFGYQVSYLMPILFRCTTARKQFQPREFNLGKYGMPIAAISSIWLTVTSIFMFLPNQYPITMENMNYTVVIVGGVLLFAMIYWLLSARHWFVGPKRIDINSMYASTAVPIKNDRDSKIQLSTDTIQSKI